jgi:hypothetical protein
MSWGHSDVDIVVWLGFNDVWPSHIVPTRWPACGLGVRRGHTAGIDRRLLRQGQCRAQGAGHPGPGAQARAQRRGADQRPDAV